MATDVTGVENVMGEVALFWQLRKFQFIEEATDFWMNAVAPKECFGDEDPDLDTTLLLNQFFTEWLLFEMPYQESTLVGITALRDEISAESRNVLKQIAETQRFSSFKMQWLNPDVIASNYRCESYFHVRHERDFWTNRQKITSKQIVFVGEAEDSVVAAGCFRATRHAIERCFTSYVDRRFRETGERIGKQSGSKNSYCLGFVEGLKQAYGEQVAADESFALAVVVPESVTRFINEQHDIKTEPKQRYIVSQDASIHDAGAEDGYGYGKGDRIADVA